jgi:phospholipid-transporting ATPase
LLDLDNDQPVYGGGQRSNLNDDDLMRFHEQNQAQKSV